MRESMVMAGALVVTLTITGWQRAPGPAGSAIAREIEGLLLLSIALLAASVVLRRYLVKRNPRTAARPTVVDTAHGRIRHRQHVGGARHAAEEAGVDELGEQTFARRAVDIPEPLRLLKGKAQTRHL